MTAAPNLPSGATRFLHQVEQALAPLALEDRDEILAEIRVHLQEKLARGGSPAVQDSLAAFGRPESYASAFLEDASIRSAIASRSVGGMFLHTLQLTGRGIVSFLTSLIVLALFAIALALGVISILKPIFPDRVGFWTFADSSSFAAGFLPANSRVGAAEHLGYWIIPLGLAAGIALFSLAIYLMRRALSRRLLRRQSLAH